MDTIPFLAMYGLGGIGPGIGTYIALGLFLVLFAGMIFLPIFCLATAREYRWSKKARATFPDLRPDAPYEEPW